MFGYVWIILLVGAVSTEKCNFRILFETVSTKHWAPDFIEELNSQVVQLNNRSYISGNIILKTNISKMDVTSQLDFWKLDKTKVRLYNLRADTCMFLSMIHKNQLLSTLAKSFKKHTCCKLRCPFIAFFNYTLNNWYLNEEEFPSYIPAGTFQTNTEYILEKKKLFRILVRGRVVY